MHNIIAKALGVIIRENKSKIDNEYNSNCGYEGWVQVELANALRDKIREVYREEKYPDTTQRCDILADGIPIELKVDTKRSARVGLENDISKIDQKLKVIAGGYAVRISRDAVGLPLPDGSFQRSNVWVWRVDVTKDSTMKNENRMEIEDENGMDVADGNGITYIKRDMSGGTYIANGVYFITVVKVGNFYIKVGTEKGL